MRMRLVPLCTIASSVACAVVLTGCAPTAGPSPSSSATPSSASSLSSAPSSAPGSPGAVAGVAAEPTDPVTDYKVTFGFAVPTGTVAISHPAPVPPLHMLVGIYAGNHPTDSPAYQRMSFYFRYGYPSYQIGYVATVVADGSGAPVSLPGNAFLRVLFTASQAHTDAGAPSIVAAPPATIGYPNLKGYASAGDYEGYVTYGLGLQVASGSGQTLPIRVGELKKSDGAGGTLYVVFVDIQTG